MDNVNDNWLDEILKSPQEEDSPKESVELTPSDKKELGRIVEETIEQIHLTNIDPETEEKDPDATLFFAPHHADETPEPEPAPAEPVVCDDTFIQGIFDAVEQDSAILVGETSAEESTDEVAVPQEGAEDAPAEEADAESVPNEEAPTEEVPGEKVSAEEAVAEEAPESAEEAVAEEAPEGDEEAAEEAPDLSADDIIREILAEDPKSKVPQTEEEVIEGILAEVAAAESEEESTEEDDYDDFDEEEEEPIRKLRPSRKEGYGFFGLPHIFSTVVWALLILFIGFTFGRTAWLCAVDVLALGKTGHEATIIITKDDTITDIAKKLETVGMIKYPSLFEAFANFTKKSEEIIFPEDDSITITFDGNLIYDYNALMNALSYQEEAADVVLVTIPEGYTCKQIFTLLEEKGVCNAADLEAYAMKGELPGYWFLEDLPRDNEYCLEGFLYPDTYEFYLEAEPKQVFEKFLDTFDLRFTDRLKGKLEQLQETLDMNLTVYDVMIMASIVQKEKANDAEGYKMSAVFYNRLMDADMYGSASHYQYLNSDATVLYATDVLGLESDEDLKKSPYNTYHSKGLPPTPICNPGLSSIDAALAPEEESLQTTWESSDPSSKTGLFFFVLNKATNEHVFAVTPEEHEKNLEELGYND